MIICSFSWEYLDIFSLQLIYVILNAEQRTNHVFSLISSGFLNVLWATTSQS